MNGEVRLTPRIFACECCGQMLRTHTFGTGPMIVPCKGECKIVYGDGSEHATVARRYTRHVYVKDAE